MSRLLSLRWGAAVLALVTVSGCKPLDDVLAALTPNRSMRSSVSYDPYENPMPPDSTSVSFASGNFPMAPGLVNLGEPEASGVDLPDFGKEDMTNAIESISNSLVNPVPADAASLERGQELYDRFCTFCHGANGQSSEAPIAPAPGLGPYMLAWNLTGREMLDYSKFQAEEDTRN